MSKNKIIERSHWAIDVPRYTDDEFNIDPVKVLKVIQHFEEYDFSQHSTPELLAFMREQACRDIPELHYLAKTEVDSRPHIPTAAEAKKKRQERAKAVQNR